MKLPPAEEWPRTWRSLIRGDHAALMKNESTVASSSLPYATPRKERQAIAAQESVKPEQVQQMIRDGLPALKNPAHSLEEDDFFPGLDSQELNEFNSLYLQQGNVAELTNAIIHQEAKTPQQQKELDQVQDSLIKLEKQLDQKQEKLRQHLIKKHEAVLKHQLSI